MCVISWSIIVVTAQTHISVERPAEKWPEVFGHIPFFVDYPYFLPCAVAGSITLIGAVPLHFALFALLIPT